MVIDVGFMEDSRPKDLQTDEGMTLIAAPKSNKAP